MRLPRTDPRLGTVADVSVRPARPEDAERVARVQLSTWRTAYASLLPAEALDVPEVQAAAMWLGAIESPPTDRHRLLVAFERTELVGFVASGPADQEDGAGVGSAELLTMLVEPRWGRRGHGSRLLAASVEHWRGWGADRAVCWVLEHDAATRSFLTSAGWEPDGAARGLLTRPDADGGDATDAPPDAPGGAPGGGELAAAVQRQLRLHTDLSAG